MSDHSHALSRVRRAAGANIPANRRTFLEVIFQKHRSANLSAR
jgi:hypothetical protein